MEEEHWHSRGYLPHFDAPGLTQSVTLRLYDSLPAIRLQQWQEELLNVPPQKVDAEMRKRIEEYLDRGVGECWLRNPEVANVVQQALLWYHGKHYQLHAWVVMPNHLHALITLEGQQKLVNVVRNWKSYTAKKSNCLLRRSGEFWQREYYDRYIRTDRHFEQSFLYIQNNPVKAGLCDRPEDWAFGSACYWKGKL